MHCFCAFRFSGNAPRRSRLLQTGPSSKSVPKRPKAESITFAFQTLKTRRRSHTRPIRHPHIPSSQRHAASVAARYNGLKINNFGALERQIASSCPFALLYGGVRFVIIPTTNNMLETQTFHGDCNATPYNIITNKSLRFCPHCPSRRVA